MKLIGVEAGGHSERPRASMRRVSRADRPACCTARNSYLLQDDDGQVALTHSVSAGLDYALVGPEHAWLHDQQRAEYTSVSDAEALAAARAARAHRGHHSGARIGARGRRGVRRAPAAKGKLFVVNLSGRGDKDTDIYRENLQELDETRRDQPAV